MWTQAGKIRVARLRQTLGGHYGMAGSLYIQPDGEVFVDTSHEDYPTTRDVLIQLGLLTRRQEPLHVYQLTPLSLWQAAAAGWTPRGVLMFLRANSRLPLPLAVQELVVAEMSKWGLCQLRRHDGANLEIVAPKSLKSTISRQPTLKKLGMASRQGKLLVPLEVRGLVRQVLAHLGIPIYDRAGHHEGVSLEVTWNDAIRLRAYQEAAVSRFFSSNCDESGIVLMPCGAGKTLVGLAILAACRCHTLIVTPGEASAQQWIRACVSSTSLRSADVGLYAANAPLYPVTVTTYQKISGRTKTGLHRHLKRLASHPWGLVIYDEVHMLPAPLFRLAAELHSVRRLGLTATLIREDGAESDVYALVGPKCYEAGWRELEQDGYLATVRCIEVRVPLTSSEEARYTEATARERYRIAGESARKLDVLQSLLAKHPDEPTLIMGQFLNSLAEVSDVFHLPLITGQTPQVRREQLFDAFRSGQITRLVLSRVANMAIDLPEATVGIQISGLYGSRQEEAQRLGRLLRPKQKEAIFYSLIADGTVEVHTARRRQMFLVEQGYQYDLVFADTQERVMEDEIVRLPK
jgi:DNA excision repair protein ERCC-3